jgi:LuxR family maltose regulon positive regulatory protein
VLLNVSIPILRTKLYIPPPRPQAVQRPRLIARLNEGLHRKLTLIASPAGFGKTTLISEWVARCGRPVAWLSLDEGDGDPRRFLTYLAAALQTLALSVVTGTATKTGHGVLDALESPQPPPIEAILPALLNEVSAVSDDFILVLDDYQLVDDKQVDSALAFLVEHLPPQMHLVITTREDPDLPLARLRARGQLTELRAADLRFTPAEAAEFLTRVMGLTLSTEDIAALEGRTEGWIAGLQLAALSMQGSQDAHGFVQAFAGDHRYIVDYLVEEVLQRQPEPVRDFLLQTAILDRLTGPLCDAVTGQPGGKARLESLQRGNFFVVPLDDTRHWYRYHHLFADVLQMHLMTERPDQAPVLHRRASEWYEQQGAAADAIRHALAGQDFERAAGLIELATPVMRKTRQDATLLGWMKALPDETFHARPLLHVEYVGGLLSNGELEGLEDRLRDAERWLDGPADARATPEASTAKMVVMDEEEFRRLPGSIAMYRAAHALILGNVPDTVRHAQQVLDLTSEVDHLLRGAAAAILGLASWRIGDLEAAHRSYAEGMTHLQTAGNLSDAVEGAVTLADMRLAQGRPREAMRTYEQALQLATAQGTPAIAVRGTADVHMGLSDLHREFNDLELATQHLLKAKALGEHAGFAQNRFRWPLAMAQIRGAEGDLDGALHLLDEAERLYSSAFSPNVRPIPAMKARMWIAQGRLAEAQAWARDTALSPDADLSYLREFEHITLARLLLARHRNNRADDTLLEASMLLERLAQAAELGGRTGSVIEILILQALARQMQGDLPAALAPLERALTLAEPEGYVRLFVDEGPPMAALLEFAAKRGASSNYSHQLLSALGKAEDKPLVKQALVEPLSERELGVLKLLRTEMGGPEIANTLMVSLNTLRTHTKNIFAKLGVNSRQAAVRRASELNLL